MDAPLASLTALAQGGGCGCKLPPTMLSEILAGLPLGLGQPDLLVGQETADDAAIYRLDAEQALVSTTDFFTPIVDDPFDFGRIAAANALSDVYAMGGRPILALALLGMPAGKLDIASVRAIMAGGAAVCAEAGIAIAGGHSIDSPALFFGLAVSGLVHPGRILRNCTAEPGDKLILTKGLGVGVIAASLRSPALDPGVVAELRRTLLRSTTRLNAVGARLASLVGVHAATDVTGFGLPGHLLEMCRGSGLDAVVEWARLPFLPGAAALARAGQRTGAARRNRASYGAEVRWPDTMPEWQRDLLCDPQTSGGLLIAVAPDCAAAVCDAIRAEGYAAAAIIGGLRRIEGSEPNLHLRIDAAGDVGGDAGLDEFGVVGVQEVEAGER